MREPLTQAEFARLITEGNGRTRVPFTQVGSAVVLGYDPLRLRENREASPDAPIVAHVRPGDPSSEQLLAHLRAEHIPHAVREVDADPLPTEELWRLLTIPGLNVRTPYTVVGDEVILGYDIPKLQRLLRPGKAQP